MPTNEERTTEELAKELEREWYRGEAYGDVEMYDVICRLRELDARVQYGDVKKITQAELNSLPKEVIHTVPCGVCGSYQWPDWTLLPHNLFNHIRGDGPGYMCLPCFTEKALGKYPTANKDNDDALTIVHLKAFEEGRDAAYKAITDIIAPGKELGSAEVIEAVKKLDATTRWRPIEEAPKDGKFLVAYDDGTVDMVNQDDSHFEFQPYTGKDPHPAVVLPTHFMPLLPAPEASQ